MHKTAIIVPCYNEAERLNGQAFAEVAAKDKSLCFIFVNDGSSDATGEKLTHLERMNPNQFRYMSLEKNCGKAEAVRRGFLAAFDAGFENIGYWDADLATPLYHIFRFCQILDTAPTVLVIGSRIKFLGKTIKRRISRHYVGRVFATVASIMLRIPVYDTQCGAKIFRSNDILKAAFQQEFNVNWTFDVELLARLLLIAQARGHSGYEVLWVEYPLDEWTDVGGSKIGPIGFVRAGIEMLTLFFLLYVPGIDRRYRRSVAGGEC
jgi:dolichyl-phosphate beta-glucosyltransferase